MDTEQLSPELQENASISKFIADGAVNVDSLGKSYVDLEAKLGSLAVEHEQELTGTVKLPGEDADDNTKREFFNKLGCPSNSKDYSEIELGEMPEGFKQDDALSNSIKEACYKVGVTDDQYKSVMEQMMKHQLVSLDNFVKNDKQTEEESKKSLVDRWGGETKFTERLELGKRLLGKYDPDGSVKEFLDSTRLGSYAPLVGLLGDIAADVLGEAATVGGAGGVCGTGKKEGEVDVSPTTGEPVLRYDKSPELMKTN